MSYSAASPTPTSVSGQGNNPVSHAKFRVALPYRLAKTLLPVPKSLSHDDQIIENGQTIKCSIHYIMATLTDSDHGNLQPVCQNCTTSTTPLWRRDEVGSVLCNACGLFLKLHGRPRPISLKTDVIKSRNRVKSAAQGQKKKVKMSSWSWISMNQ